MIEYEPHWLVRNAHVMTLAAGGSEPADRLRKLYPVRPSGLCGPTGPRNKVEATCR